MKERALAAATVLALLVVSPARAQQPSAADRETARASMDDGDKKRDEGDLKGALKSYEAADAIMKVPTTGLEVARTQLGLGLLIEAKETLERVLRTPARANEPAPFVTARKSGAALVADVTTRIPSIQVTLTNVPPNATAQITIDGEPIPPAAAQVPRKINPGAHTVVVRVGEAKSESRYDERKEEVTVVEREAKTVTFDLKERRPDPPQKPAPRETDTSLPTILTFGGFGLAAVGIGVGAVTGLLSLSKTNDLKDVCPNNACPAGKQADIDSANTLGNVSTVAFVVGGAGAAAGVLGIVLGQGLAQASRRLSGEGASRRSSGEGASRRSNEERTSVSATVGPSYIGLRGSF